MQLFELVFVPEDANLGGLEILNILFDEIFKGCLLAMRGCLGVELVEDIAIAPFVDLLIEHIEELIVVVLVLVGDIGEEGKDVGLELVVVEVPAAECLVELTIHQ